MQGRSKSQKILSVKIKYATRMWFIPSPKMFKRRSVTVQNNDLVWMLKEIKK